MNMLDFNAITSPVWPVKLKDADQTMVSIMFPTVDLFDRLAAMIPELEAVRETKDGKTIKAVYGLVAELMSCNEDGFVFKAEELRDTYHMSLLDVFKFVAGYMEFIGEAQNAKN